MSRAITSPSPTAHAAAGAGPGDQARQHLIAQVIVVVRFAEEARDVGGQRRQHLLAFVEAFAAGHQGAVVLEAGQAERAQALGQPRIDQRRLAVGQADARLGVEELRNLLEVLGRKGELAIDQGLAAL